MLNNYLLKMIYLFAASVQERMSEVLGNSRINIVIFNEFSVNLSPGYKVAEPDDFYIIPRLPVLILRLLDLLSQCL